MNLNLDDRISLFSLAQAYIPRKLYKEIFNSDGSRYGGSNKGNMGGKETINYNIHDYQNALELALPPLSVSIFKHQSKN